MGKADTGSTTRNNKTICLPFLQEVYNDTKTPISAIPDWSQNALKQRSKEFTFRKLFLKFSLKPMASAIFLQ
ncbi:hypothetical protein BuS5_02216 [Desulfosarcina sp. BuS5]|nr:hypothetical protein BuS5_02216 [Desulfosarcina sp. BuS5]